MASDSLRRVTLAELVATLSLVADLGMGRPMERVLRQTVIAMRLGAAAGMEEATRTSAYYTSLLTWVGCAVDTSEVAALFGDETELYADTRDEDLGGITLAATRPTGLALSVSRAQDVPPTGELVDLFQVAEDPMTGKAAIIYTDSTIDTWTQNGVTNELPEIGLAFEQ